MSEEAADGGGAGAGRGSLDDGVDLAVGGEAVDPGFGEGGFDVAQGVGAARSQMVRAGVVRGMPCLMVTSLRESSSNAVDVNARLARLGCRQTVT